MSHRDFLAIPDFSRDELLGLFDLAERMRTGAYAAKPLAGKSLAMLFMKASTRTRVSFEVGAWQLGGHALFLSPRDIQLGRGEPVADTARVLSRYVDGIMIRTFAHAEVARIATSSRSPTCRATSCTRSWPSPSACARAPTTGSRSPGSRSRWSS